MQRRINIWAKIDWLTILLFSILVFLGWLNIYAAVYNEEHHSIFDFSQRYGKQLIWIIAALLIAILVFFIDINFYSYFAYGIYAFIIVILLGVLIFGKTVHGAKSWLVIGGFQIQPSEFMKFATGLALARFLSAFNVQIGKVKTYLKAAFFILLPSLLILLQNDTGSALVFFAFFIVLYREGLPDSFLFVGIALILLFILSLILEKIVIISLVIGIIFIIYWIFTRHTKFTLLAVLIFVVITGGLWSINYYTHLSLSSYYVILIGLGLASLLFLYYSYQYKLRRVPVLLIFLFGSIIFTFSVDYVFNDFLEPHQQKRINHVLGIESDPLGAGYNVNQSKIAIGSGGFTGKGFLKGTQTKFDFVPEQSTDFIFCTIGEEWGFIGTFLIILLFIIFLIRLIKIAERQRSAFSRIYGYSVLSVFLFHIVVNIGMTIGLMPVVGIPLPFFSYGGSSLWAFTILLFILLRLDASRLELLK